MYVLLCLLVISSFTCVGLGALGAGASRRHWFVRTAVICVPLCVLLFVPAYEPFVALVVEVVVIAGGLACVQFVSSHFWRRSSETRLEGAPIRFSLMSLLCLTIVVAVAAAIGVRLPQLSWIAWLNTANIGVAAGVAVLVGAWLARGRIRWRGRVPIALVACMLIALPLALTDYLLDSFSAWGEPWPPPGPGAAPPYSAVLHWLWLVILPAVALATALWLTTVLSACDRLELKPGGARRCSFHRIPAVGLSAALMFLPTYVLYRMLTPTPIPVRVYPTPNGYDLLTAVTRTVQDPVLEDYTAATPAALAAAVTAKQRAFQQLRDALAYPSLARIDFRDRSLESRHLRDIQDSRSLARAVMAEARFAEFEERLADAGAIYADNIELGQRVTSGGLLIHALVGAAIQNMGNSGLSKIRRQLPTGTAAQLARRLWEIEDRREPFEDLVANDRLWMQHALGWHGRVSLALADLAGDEPEVHAIIRKSYLRAATLTRLLIAELAIQAHFDSRGEPPDRLETLIPDFLPGVPIDPCSEEPLRYQSTGSEWLVYSVGYDGRDDGGRPPGDDDYLNWHNGDISLAAWWDWLEKQ